MPHVFSNKRSLSLCYRLDKFYPGSSLRCERYGSDIVTLIVVFALYHFRVVGCREPRLTRITYKLSLPLDDVEIAARQFL